MDPIKGGIFFDDELSLIQIQVRKDRLFVILRQIDIQNQRAQENFENIEKTEK